ncbi:prolyl oligopeptidase family protein [Pseudoroseomonas cervicalis]|uniref:Peptidase, S9A/B/C family, catalytic domain protein n=1 Tax=Pseudoroseomonas cervicalis ATCC 49957 TaxID=525371 RepID=D5RHI2_9PROT|nr:prolyl oligopeptidase family serine peptidase [Pseudoroseomonas cervicalis]EFH13234.1 peptidase, S9A/B/C family, catalytic domain protein [Pseudoroseomonas cervicalis ATCC 49957]
MDEDPFLWLEEIEGGRALEWVAAQNARTLAALEDARLAADRDGLKAALDRPGKLPHVTRRGAHLFNLWQDAAHPRGLWRRTSLDSFRTESPEWEVLLDLDALAATEGEDWVWAGSATLPGRHDRALLRLSRGGGDAVVIREFDIPTRRFVEDGFTLPEAKSGAAWLDRDTLLLSTALGAGNATSSGYARTVRLWRRGGAPLEAPVLFEAPEASMSVGGMVEHEGGQEILVFIERTGFFDVTVWLGDRDGPKTRLPLPSDAHYTWQHGHLAVKPRTPWTVEGETYATDTLLGLSLADLLAGRVAPQILFTPGPRLALQGFFWCDGRLVLSVLDNLAPLYRLFTPGPGAWASQDLPGLPRIGVVDLWPLDAEAEESDGTLLVMAQDPVTPPQLLLASASAPAAPALLKASTPSFDASGLTVTRHEAVSTDGERIPYVQIGPRDESGQAPVHLSAYGGFQISRLPYYSATTGRLWLEKGGTAVIGQIRGGGEFGTAWHEAGRGPRKRQSHDDFAAIAQDLVRRGVTVPGRIAAEGGSNGGLLIANMLTRYPERFGALFCTIPLIDMRRYTKLLAGASWIAEYGDPDKPEDWAFMRHFSAYQAVEPGRPYPPILLATTRRDDRVHPGHARKMAARLQEMGYAAWFYEPEAGGHGYGKDNAEVARFAAIGAAFLRRAIGWEAPAGG